MNYRFLLGLKKVFISLELRDTNFNTTNTGMKRSQNSNSLPQAKNSDELELLKDYSSYLMEQVNEMKLHPAHKEDIKEILLTAMVGITIHYERYGSTRKPQGFLSRMLHRTER